MDDPCPPPGAQFPLQYIQRIFLGAHLVKIFDLIALAAAVAVNAAMAAAPVQIHIVVAAKPILLLTVAGKDGFCRDIFHHFPFPFQINTVQPRFSKSCVKIFKVKTAALIKPRLFFIWRFAQCGIPIDTL